MHGAQERKPVVRTGPSNTSSGKHTANTVLLLRASTCTCMCRASIGRHFREDKAGRSFHSKTRIRPYMSVTLRRAWEHGLLSANIVTQCQCTYMDRESWYSIKDSGSQGQVAIKGEF